MGYRSGDYWYCTTDQVLCSTARAIIDARKKQLERLRAMYPIGAPVLVKLSSSQKNPSAGVIESHSTNAYGGLVGVRLDKAKQWSRYQIRSISPEDVTIIGKPPKGKK